MTGWKKVVVVGLDGLEPTIVDGMLSRGRLPNLQRLRARGGFTRVQTTAPAQTPVAWSTFSTGTNPGGHGIFDFVRRDPATYLPDLGLNRYEQKNAFLPPRAVNLRRGTAFWELLSQAGVPSVVLRCPCTYPPDNIRGSMLSGMGVPDVRGGLGTATFYTTAADVVAGESEHVVRLRPEGTGYAAQLIGPRNPKTGEDTRLDMRLDVDRSARRIVIRSAADPEALEVREGSWSSWLRVKFKLGMLQSVRGMMRFYLVRTEPQLELYASPVNFDPDAPMFPLSSPWEYARDLSRQTGLFYTTGMVEDHTGLNNGRIDEAAFLAQCDDVLGERERMLFYELDRLDDGFLFCLFDTPDRVQHMFWRYRDASHPAHSGDDFAQVIEDHYRRCDTIIGGVLDRVDDRTLVIALSDHGFGSFRRGVNLNTWLYDNGFLALKPGVKPGAEAGDLLRNIDWSRTRAYATGLSGIFLNLRDREGNGIVARDDAARLTRELAARLTGLRDGGTIAISRVQGRDELYRGAFVSEAPDVIVNYAPGYRVSWATGLGGVPAAQFEDNTKKWSGDHIIDPQFVPGVLLMNQPFDATSTSLVDLAPTILDAFGVPAGAQMEGRSLLASAPLTQVAV